MKKIMKFNFLLVALCIAIILSLFMTVSVVADDGTPTPGAGEEQTPISTEEPPQDGTEEAATEIPEDFPTPEGDNLLAPTPEPVELDGDAPAENSLSLPEVQEELPQDAAFVVLIDGEVEPLVTQAAADAIVIGDPIWCPATVAPDAGMNGCTPTQPDLYTLIDGIRNNIIAVLPVDGIIWIEAGTDADLINPILIDGVDFTTIQDFQLTLQGGWDGTPSGTIVPDSSTTNYSVPIVIENWNNSVTVNNLNIANAGLSIDIDSGNVALNNISVTGNAGDGASILAPGNVTLGGAENNFNNNTGAGLSVDAGGDFTSTTSTANIFNDNGSTGLVVEVDDDVSVSNITASGNGFNGIDILAADDVALSGVSVFNNDFSGLLIDAGGDVVIDDLTADNNGLGGAFGTGAEIYSLASFTLTGVNTFNDNLNTGLVVDATGNIVVENVTASFNGSGSSLAGGAEFYTSGSFNMTGANVFSYNNDTGLYVESNGNITAENITAEGNGVRGVYGVGAEFYASGVLSLTGANVFNNNLSSGMYVEATTGIMVEGTDAMFNGGSGLDLITNGDADVTCGELAGNGFLAIDTGMTGILSLFGVNFNGHPDDVIGISADRLNLVSNGCFSYPDYYAEDGGGEAFHRTLPQSSDSGIENTIIKFVYGADGIPVVLDCRNYAGTLLRLANGDGALLPCPIVDMVQLNSLLDLMAAPLPDGSVYISGMELIVTKEGLALQNMQESNVVWFVNPANQDTGGYQASYFDGSSWEDATGDVPPFMTLFFVIPESAKGKNLAIMYWDGTTWVELAGGTHLGNGRIIRTVGPSADGLNFQASLNFIGDFVLVEKK